MKKIVAVSILAICSVGLSMNAAIAKEEDQFSDIDCKQEQMNTLGMKVCAGRALAKTEKELKAQRTKLLNSADAKTKKVMKAWFKASTDSANAQCEVEGLRYDGGSMQTLVEATCLDSEYQRQLDVLKEYEKFPE